jgi:hypothetical protein
MMDLVRQFPDLRVRLLSGLQAGLLERALGDPEFKAGTLITA